MNKKLKRRKRDKHKLKKLRNINKQKAINSWNDLVKGINLCKEIIENIRK